MAVKVSRSVGVRQALNSGFGPVTFDNTGLFVTFPTEVYLTDWRITWTAKVGNFTVGEPVTFTSGATGNYMGNDGTPYIILKNAGTPVNGDTVTGTLSGATLTLVSFTTDSYTGSYLYPGASFNITGKVGTFIAGEALQFSGSTGGGQPQNFQHCRYIGESGAAMYVEQIFGIALTSSTTVVGVTSRARAVVNSVPVNYPANWGRGDVLVVGGETLYVEQRLSESVLQLQTPSVLNRGATLSITSLSRAYTTIPNWITGEVTARANLVSRDEIAECACTKDATLTDVFNLTGFTADANCYPLITAAPGSRHTGLAGTGAVMNPSTSATAITLSNTFAVLEWLELTDWGGGGFISTGVRVAAANCTVRNNIIHDEANANAGYAIAYSASAAQIYNNLIYETGTPTCISGIRASVDPLTAVICINNTVYNMAASGIYKAGAAANTVYANNLVMNCPACYSIAGYDAASTANMSSDNTAIGVVNYRGYVAANQFILLTGTYDLNLKKTADAIGKGAVISGSQFLSDTSARLPGYTLDLGADSYTVDPASVGTKASYSTGTLAIAADGRTAVLSGGSLDAGWGEGDTLTLLSEFSNEFASEFAAAVTPVHSRVDATNIQLHQAVPLGGLSGRAYVLSRAYSGINAWLSAVQTLPVAGRAVKKCVPYNDFGVNGLDEYMDFGASPGTQYTNINYYLWVYVPVTQRHDGTVNGSGFLLNATTVPIFKHAIVVNAAYSVFEGLKIFIGTGHRTNACCITAPGGNYGIIGVKVKHSLCYCKAGFTTAGALLYGDGQYSNNYGWHFHDNILISDGNCAYGIRVLEIWDIALVRSLYYNNSIYGNFTGAGLRVDTGGGNISLAKLAYIKNNYACSTGAGADYSFDAGPFQNTLSNFAYNGSDDTSAGTANRNVQVAVASAKFKNLGAAVQNLGLNAGSALAGRGVGPALDTNVAATDIFDVGRTSRGGRVSTLGAVEQAAPAIPIFDRYYRNRRIS